jgi:hypothetical protein
MPDCNPQAVSLRLRCHQLPVLLALAVWLSVPSARSQFVSTGQYALDVPVDARTIAMGESFVALPANSMALMENVAGLSGLHGVGAMYSHRQFDWLPWLGDSRYVSAGGFLCSDFGTLAVLYNRFTLGSVVVTSPAGPSTTLQTESHNHFLSVGFARQLTEHLSAGIALKGYTQVVTVVAGDAEGFSYQATGSFMADLGLLYSLPVLLDLGPMDNTATLGLSLQNFGTDFRESVSSVSSPAPPESYLVKLPRYLRFGVSYSLLVPPISRDELTPCSITLTGEYRGLLNPDESQESDRDFWGFGAEFTILEIVTGRIGGYIEPYTSIYGSRAVPALRYGIGVTIPFKRLGLDVPLRISVDYAGIPLSERTALFSFMGNPKSTLRAFSLEVVYTDAVF